MRNEETVRINFCGYWNKDIFDGYVIWVDESGETNDRLCYSKDNYYDIVIDYLNNDVKSLKGYIITLYSSVEKRLKKEFDLPNAVEWYNDIGKNVISYSAPSAFLSEKKRLESIGTPDLWDKSFALCSQALNEIEYQINAMPIDKIKNFVNHTLVDNGDCISSVDSLTRSAIFNLVFRGEFEIVFSQTLNFSQNINSQKREDDYKQWKHDHDFLEILDKASFSNNEEVFNELCRLETGYKNSFVPLVDYSFDSMPDMILFVLLEMIKNNCKVKICPNCGRYFVPQNRSDELYCRNISPQDENKTCQEYGKYMTYLEKSRTDEATKLYKQIYNAKANKVKRTGNDVLKADLNAFRERAKIWRTDIKSGAASENDYIAWLKSVKAGDSDNGEY